MTRRAARFFNEALPCAARVRATRSALGFVLAGFELRPRDGAACEGTALVAVEVRDGLITRWVRLAPR